MLPPKLLFAVPANSGHRNSLRLGMRCFSVKINYVDDAVQLSVLVCREFAK